jgi:hypothetical protein
VAGQALPCFATLSGGALKRRLVGSEQNEEELGNIGKWNRETLWFMKGESLVTTAWRVLGLSMEDRPPAMEGSCECIE